MPNYETVKLTKREIHRKHNRFQNNIQTLSINRDDFIPTRKHVDDRSISHKTNSTRNIMFSQCFFETRKCVRFVFGTIDVSFISISPIFVETPLWISWQTKRFCGSSGMAIPRSTGKAYMCVCL